MGVVVDSGDGVTYVVSVVDGYLFLYFIKWLNVVGRYVMMWMIDLLMCWGYLLNWMLDVEMVCLIKEELCYVAYDYKRDL